MELPGAYVRGRTEAEALSKVPGEARSYLNWLGAPLISEIRARVVETHRCHLAVEDADSEILLASDRSPMNQDELRRLTGIVRRSGETFKSLYESSALRDWVDTTRIRKTFYGDVPKTIREVFDHVERTQHYYLSRIGLGVEKNQPFISVRESGVGQIERLFETKRNSEVYYVDDESWTVKKVLRRFVWHDRIHGKAIVRILAKQKRLGLIDSYEDVFRFGL